MQLSALSAEDLKAFYMQCDRAAAQGSLGGDVALCSLAYELLLKGAFDGDFFALLAWWRSEMRAETACAALGNPERPRL
ncbi:MAG TPA: hypothetical protein VFR86_25275 [Burkholderiaceae bacterium]|nr:hypothetical protein [Burkholderiaceae bacterium]